MTSTKMDEQYAYMAQNSDFCVTRKPFAHVNSISAWVNVERHCWSVTDCRFSGLRDLEQPDVALADEWWGKGCKGGRSCVI